MKKIKFLLITIAIIGLSYTACEDMDIADIGIEKIEEAAAAGDNTTTDTTTSTPVFVAVGGDAGEGKIYYSYNGTDWTATSYSGEKMNDVTYDYTKKIFISVGDSSEIWTSLDGVTWEDHHPGSSFTNNLYGVTAGDNLIVAVGAYDNTEFEHTVLSSSDGENWMDNATTLPDTPAGTNLAGVAFHNNEYFTIENYSSSNQLPLYHTNAVDITNWSSTISVGGVMNNYAYDTTSLNNQLLVMGSFDSIAQINYLNAESTWDNYNIESYIQNPQGIIYNNERYIVVGNNSGTEGKIAYTDDNIISSSMTWTPSAILPNATPVGSFNDISYGNNTLVAVGENGAAALLFYSTDNGSTFTQVTGGAVSVPLLAIAYKKD